MSKPFRPPSVLQCELPGCGKVRIVRQTDVRWYDENVPRSHRFECSELWHCKCADRADDDDPKTKSKWIGRGGRALIDGPEGHILPNNNAYFGEKPLPSAAREQVQGGEGDGVPAGAERDDMVAGSAMVLTASKNDRAGFGVRTDEPECGRVGDEVGFSSSAESAVVRWGCLREHEHQKS